MDFPIQGDCIPMNHAQRTLDKLVKLWDFHQDDVTRPTLNLSGPRANILTLAFSENNRYLYSGGVCETVYRYDISTLGVEAVSPTPQGAYIDSDDSIRSISCHPFNEDLALTASEDGCIYRYDARDVNTRRTRENTLELNASASGALYHPTMAHIFLTSDSRGRVCLRDERMAFGSGERTDGGIVQRYNTNLTKKTVNHLSNPEASSIVFDRTGSKFAITMVNFFPTIFSTSDPNPIAICSGKYLPNGDLVDTTSSRTYQNACTMKHGSFGGPGMDEDIYYGAELVEQRREINASDWHAAEPESTIAFTAGFSQPKYVPVDISQPFCHLNGHLSIVNTIVFHPQFLHVATAGVEKDIILHSPTPGSPCTRDLARSPLEVRKLSEDGTEDRLLYYTSLVSDIDRTEARTISLFDHLIREESDNDIFLTRRWRPDTEDEEDSDEEMAGDSSSGEESDQDIDPY
ncbi:hypothetical protein CC2G_004929 [Coprinopsis cinerea AmutBmut pab1-1]|nr:hypothetical protein CC2G_004929 [Coprinopsis cinerea AmutBmut pab1-1]